jgi:endonuclease YncB( thermonuclease family)
LKKINLLLITVLILSIIAISGCTSQNNNSINKYSISDHNQTSNQPSEVNNTLSTSKTVKYEASGYCPYVVDGDTIDVDGVGRIRFVGVNTPERGQPGYQVAKDFVKSQCLGKTVGLDIDDAKHYDKYGRVLAVVYVGNTNLNAELLKRGYAEVMYIPPSEFNPYTWT